MALKHVQDTAVVLVLVLVLKSQEALPDNHFPKDSPPGDENAVLGRPIRARRVENRP